jgi:hypothetical protein
MSDQNIYQTTVYTIPFIDFYCSSTGGATFSDLWSIKGTTLGRTRIRSINIGQKSTNVTGNQQLDVQIYRGSTALGGGAAVTPVNTKGWATAASAASLAYAPSSTALASTASAVPIYADNTDWSGNWLFPGGDEEGWGYFTLEAAQNFNVRVSTPPSAAPVYLSGTLVIEDVNNKAV